MSSSDNNSSNNSTDSSNKESWNDRVNRFLATGHAHLHASVATAVDGINAGLAAAEKMTVQVRAPVHRAWQQASAVEEQVESQLAVVYKRRHEIGPQIVAGGALTGGVLSMIRRRSIFRFLSGSILFGGLTYVAVYEPIPIKKIPQLIKEQFQPKEK